MRSSVRATSMPPQVVLTPRAAYCRWLSRVSIAISRLWSVGKMKFGRVAGRAAGVGERPLVDEHEVAPAELGEVRDQTVADDAGADDGDARPRPRCRAGAPGGAVVSTHHRPPGGRSRTIDRDATMHDQAVAAGSQPNHGRSHERSAPQRRPVGPARPRQPAPERPHPHRAAHLDGGCGSRPTGTSPTPPAAWRATVYNRVYHPRGYVRPEDGGAAGRARGPDEARHDVERRGRASDPGHGTRRGAVRRLRRHPRRNPHRADARPAT